MGLIGDGAGMGTVDCDDARLMTPSKDERAVCMFKFKAMKPSVASVSAKTPPLRRIYFLLIIIINKSLIQRP